MAADYTSDQNVKVKDMKPGEEWLSGTERTPAQDRAVINDRIHGPYPSVATHAKGGKVLGCYTAGGKVLSCRKC